MREDTEREGRKRKRKKRKKKEAKGEDEGREGGGRDSVPWRREKIRLVGILIFSGRWHVQRPRSTDFTIPPIFFLFSFLT